MHRRKGCCMFRIPVINRIEFHRPDFTREQADAIQHDIYLRGDAIIARFITLHALIALGLAHFYATWWIAGIVTSSALAMFFGCRRLLPGRFITRCAAGVALQIFVILHIYQLHGMAEMHFFFFTGLAMMIVYQDWRAMLPGTLLIVGQHTLFAALTNSGVNLFFFDQAFVNWTKLAFHFGIVSAHVGVCGFWAVWFQKQTLHAAQQQRRLHENQGELTFQLQRAHAGEEHLQHLTEALNLQNAELEQRVAERTAELAQAIEQLASAHQEMMHTYDVTLEGWSKALDLRDKETEGHTRRVTEMSVALARALGMSAAEVACVRRGALLHDVGKLGIPDAILLKPGKLTEEEWVTMRLHPVYAYEWLRGIEYLTPALDIPRYHHEKWDGTGYPCGLKGEDIPLAARIFALVDVWDALRSDRPYRVSWPHEKVRDHVASLSGTHFDPQLVALFLDLEAQYAGSEWASTLKLSGSEAAALPFPQEAAEKQAVISPAALRKAA